MQITLNGERQYMTDGLTIALLIAELGVDPTQVAVEKNGDIAPKSAHAHIEINDGDTIELVRFIGGG